MTSPTVALPTLRIGKTPIVDAALYSPPLRSDVFLKLEKYNQFGSIKDRAAIHIINVARRRGELPPGGTIIESSSGNLGVALAAIGSLLGHKAIIIVDPKTSARVISRIQTAGGVVVVEDRMDVDGNYHRSRIERARSLSLSVPGSYWVNQTSNPLNSEAHFLSLGPEIFDDFGTDLNFCVMSTSSGGHLSGVSRYLRCVSPNTKIVAVDIQGSTIFGGPGHQYRTPGMGLAWKPTTLESTHIDLIFQVSDRDTFSMAHLLEKRGLYVGPSSGAVAFVCCHIGQKFSLKKVLGILPDGGEGYALTAFSTEWLSKAGIRLYSESELADRLSSLTPLEGSAS